MRSNHSVKSKSSAPVPLPHDGPIFWAHHDYVLHRNLHVSENMRRRKKRNQDHEEDPPPMQDPSDMMVALHLLQLAGERGPMSLEMDSPFRIKEEDVDPDDDDDDEDDEVATLAVKTIQTLQSASTIQAQLQALQRFKSTLLNNNNGSSKDSSSKTIQKKMPIMTGSFLSGLYRVLLEWSLSCHTTVPLQRAIHSCLQTLETTTAVEGSRIVEQVLNSLWEQSPFSSSLSQQQQPPPHHHWKDPLHVLDVAVNTPLLVTRLKEGGTIMIDKVLSFMYHQWVQTMMIQTNAQMPPHRRNESDAPNDHKGDNNSNNYSNDDDEWVSKGLLLCKLIKILLQSQSLPIPLPTQKDIVDTKLRSSLSCINSQSTSITPTNNTSSSGNPVRIIPYCDELEALVVRLMNSPMLPVEGFSTLGIVFARLHLNPRVQDIHHWNSQDLAHKAILAIQALTTPTISNINAQEGVVQSALSRLSIVQGISATLDSSALLLIVSSLQGSTPLEECWKYVLHVSQVAIDPMARWAALKGLSTMATRWKQLSEDASPEQTRRFEGLIQDTMDVILQAWENPPLRKLGTAIPGIFQALVEFLSELQRQNLCRCVLNQPISRKGRFLALEILLPYMSPNERIELLQAESLIDGVGDRGPNARVIADLWIKLLGYAWDHSEQRLEEWAKLWLLPLTQSLVEGNLSRRRQVLAFCVIRLLDLIKRDQSLRDVMSQFVAMLFDAISETTNAAPAYRSSAETHNDRILWVHLELARIVRTNKFLSPDTKLTIAGHVTLGRLYSALGHELSYLRISAFLALDTIVVDVYNLGLEDEANIWKMFMPLVMKTSETSEHTNILLQCKFSFLDRLSAHEAAVVMKSNTLTPLTQLPTTFYSFVNDFVIGLLILKQGLYPGTVSEKEEFSLLLLENLIAFVLQDQSYAADGSARNGSFFLRQRAPVEKVAMRQILKSLLHQEVFASLFSLLYTQWDATRANAFRVLTKLVQAAHDSELTLPEIYSVADGRIHLESRGMYLASSPRQREAQTGSQLLAFAYISLKNFDERNEFLTRIIDCLKRRLTEMQSSLESILNGDDDATVIQEGKQLPLAHGIIHAILLIVRYHDFASRASTGLAVTCQGLDQHCERLLSIFCRAIQLSLKIIADIRNGETIDGLEDETSDEDGLFVAKGSCTPLNVNTGAIGANGTVSRLSHADEDDHGRRLATQRIVVGTWLLIKETCAAASTVISSKYFAASPSSVLKVGSLLISTMTSLKHAGAAFAARDSLQDIACTCLRSKDPDLKAIPGGWTDRLMTEMCSNETVRDSTLRRSTGYALGYQAMMRSDFSNRLTAGLCRKIMKSLITYSLPMVTELKQALYAMDCLGDSQEVSSLFSCGNDSDIFYVPDTAYEARCRVHALNVLRMLILDAPLSPAVSPFIGDSIISSLLGYTDPSWAVRNSSTMVFSAAMLRVVDADKNGSNVDRTSNQAITLSELFRRYPPLATFLLAMMKHGIALQEKQANSQLFPILLLISRTQPVEQSGMLASTQAYPDLIFKALENRHHAIRAAASRALINVTTEDNGPSSSSVIIRRCVDILNDGSLKVNRNWNLIDGALLVLERLVLSFTSDEQQRGIIITQGLESVLRAIVDQRNSIVFPPPCVATALNILTALARRKPSHSFLLTICSSLTSDGRYQKVPGGPVLYTSAAASVVELTRDLWNSCDENALDRKLQQLRLNFSSEIVDVRIASVKTFKKSVYENIDSALTQKNRAIPPKVTLVKVASMILECTEAETRQAKPHVPTVRRLSRCLLEIFDGYCSLEEPDIKEFCVATNTKSHLLWETADAMIEHEGLLKDSVFRPHGETFLAGNAVEMMAIQIGADVVSEASVQDRLNKFTTTICRLNNMQASWRSRYSAVKAMGTSRLLSSKSYESSSIRNVLLFEILKMLQDSDPDVRRCAAHAATQVETLQTQETGMIVDSSLPAPTLRRLYPAAYGLASDSDGHSVGRARSLLQIIADNTKDLSHDTVSLGSELDHSRDADDPWKISNASTSRDIFEIEDVNSSNERLLSGQLAILELINNDKGPNLLDDVAHRYTYGIIQILRNSLENLIERKSLGGIVHDMSRFPSIFPSLHTLLGTVAALIYSEILAAIATDKLAQLCDELLESSCALHPEILSALKCLRMAKSKDAATKEMVRKMLFLL